MGRRAHAVLLAGIVVCAVALRLLHIGREELRLDECGSILVCRGPEGLLAALRADNHPPLYFLLLRGWTALFGIGEAAVRALSVLFGAASLGALAAWLRQLGCGRRASLWAVFYGAVSAIHFYYSREARPYALLVLCAVLAAWMLARACRGGGWKRWLAFALSMTAGLYSHDLFALWLPVLWLMFLLLRPASWRGLIAAHVALLVLYTPWLLAVWDQPKTQATAWVGAMAKSRELHWAIPRTLEGFSVGGALPGHLRFPAANTVVRVKALLWSALLAACVAAAAVRFRRRVRWPAALLTVALVVPLAELLAVALLFRPLYLVGRYDILALPGFLGLAGMGLSLLQRRLRWLGWLSWALPAAATLALAAAMLVPALALRGAAALQEVQRARGIILRREARADDLVVSFGQEASKVAVQMLQRGIDCDMMTYPLGTRRHMGWLDPADYTEDALRRDAARVVGQLAGPAPRYGRVWLMLDPFAEYRPKPGEPPNYMARAAQIFTATAESAGLLRAEAGSTSGTALRRAGMAVMATGRRAPAPAAAPSRLKGMLRPYLKKGQSLSVAQMNDVIADSAVRRARGPVIGFSAKTPVVSR